MESRIQIEKVEDVINIFGKFDENIKIIEQTFNVTVVNRESEIKITGTSGVDLASKCILKLLDIVKRGEAINLHTVNYIISLIMEENEGAIDKILKDVILVTPRGKYIKCKTIGQQNYIEAINKHDVVFGIGPAGTGKTYLAIAMAVKMLKERKVGKIILTRPAVEAGERLGFLPGDLQEKIDPYLRPLYDALYDTLGPETFQKYMESGIIEVAPLAYMRGRTLDDSFIILDEAQNTTPEQMKMFLTRFGYGSRIVVTGDITQVDLGQGKLSGLKQVTKVLKDVEGIEMVYFSHKDVVRHKLVMQIIKAYEKWDKDRESKKEEKESSEE
ncbi:PhoH family protein [Clostridium cylindrosporum]|uniref:PhoH-like protein n=1 Tax=Clostridium cylindrosporum DSM 605 TaxID=1121307 RepID=A0A0J8DBI1_CLOCY|nr:PhoH family protein [Clostridium cylindrosporum]KMT21653.1 PhoH-like protein [Clostridium cylindrosporum DSM 605]